MARSMSSALHDFPKRIEVENHSFRFSGDIGYSSSYFTAYYYRITGHWEIYDDLHKKVDSCTSSKLIEQHAVIYSRIS